MLSIFILQLYFSDHTTLNLNIEMTSDRIKVAVLGAAGGIGQPLSLLIQMDPNVDEIALFVIVSE